MKRVAILQSNYLPWKGYFDIINDVDLFIFYDDVQYTKNDWRNRNKIKTSDGTQWITIPIGAQNDLLINEVEVKGDVWKRKHFNSIKANYSRAPFYKNYKDFLETFYFGHEWTNLSEINQYLIVELSRILGIKTLFARSQDFSSTGNKTNRLISLLKEVEATHYISGPAAKSYLNTEAFYENNIELIYKGYEGYPIYPQSGATFEHSVSIIDLLFHTGAKAPYYIWGWRDE
ncbi:WbqC family protein [Cohnella sp. GbtcB17]|uniref:WbqC family protein n=1 Tax=Cohnella sp. GbtcB17 TaxID=2824762 RepID=UPI001C308725|nr:WbqC family protein [Cohnella sp. GbtcB17]